MITAKEQIPKSTRNHLMCYDRYVFRKNLAGSITIPPEFFRKRFVRDFTNTGESARLNLLSQWLPTKNNPKDLQSACHMQEKMAEHCKNNKTSDSNAPIDVTCAIIEKNGQVLAAQRGPAMAMPFKWEFPGGKINPGETAEECITREIKEELGIEIQIKTMLPQSSHSYPNLHVRLHPFVCRIINGRILPAEHRAVQWTSHDQLLTLEWAEADVAVVKSYLDYRIGKDGHNNDPHQ